MKPVYYILAILMLNPLFASAQTIQWQTEVEPSQKTQPALLYFYSSASLDWEKNQQAFQHSLVQKMAESFHCFKLDLQQSPYHPISSKYKIYKPPTVVLLKEDGTEKARFEGAFSQEQLLTEMGQLAGHSYTAPAAVENLPDIRKEPAWLSLCLDKQDVEGGQRDFAKAEYRVTEENLELLITFFGSADINGFHFCLDADKNSETGFASQNIAGYELMIEGGTLYSFGGKQSTEWVWNSLNTVKYSLDGSHLKIEVPLTQLKLQKGSTYSCAFNTNNDEWVTVEYMPDEYPAVLKLE